MLKNYLKTSLNDISPLPTKCPPYENAAAIMKYIMHSASPKIAADTFIERLKIIPWLTLNISLALLRRDL